MRRSYLVTGGAGFIGSHLVEALLARDEIVVAFDNLSTGRLRNLDHLGNHPNLRFVHGSVLDELAVDELMHKCDVVVHLAAAVGVKLIVEEPLRSFTTNIRGSEIVIESAFRHRRPILLTSTSEIYGKNTAVPLKEEDDRILGTPTVARWAYSTAKAVDEILAYDYNRERGLPTTVVRLFNTVGPRQIGQYGMVIPRFVQAALAGAPLEVHGDGTQTRSFCHVSDTIRALEGLMDAPQISGEVFNVGSTERIRIIDLAERVRQMTRSRSEIEFVSYDEVYGLGIEDTLHREPSIDKISRAIGWRPSLDLDRILGDVVDHTRRAPVALDAP